MSSNLVIAVRPVKVGVKWFADFDLSLLKIGFQPQRGRTGTANPVGVLIDDEGDGEVVPWPIRGESFNLTKSLMVHYGIFGRRDRTHGFGLTYLFDDDRFLEEIWIEHSVPPFMACYSESWLDMYRRLAAITEAFAEVLDVSSAKCTSDSGKIWTEYSGGSWITVPYLQVEEIDEDSLMGLQTWAAEADNPVRQLQNSFVISPFGEPDAVALLRSSPLDGSALARSPSDDEFGTVDGEDEDGFRRICWGSARGIEDIVGRFGRPDVELPPFDPNWYRAADDEIVERQVAYFDINPRYVVLFRQLRNGRTTLTLAGKRITTPR